MYFIMIFKSAFLQWTDAEKKILKFTAPCHEDNFLNETAHTHENVNERDWKKGNSKTH